MFKKLVCGVVVGVVLSFSLPAAGGIFHGKLAEKKVERKLNRANRLERRASVVKQRSEQRLNRIKAWRAKSSAGCSGAAKAAGCSG